MNYALTEVECMESLDATSDKDIISTKLTCVVYYNWFKEHSLKDLLIKKDTSHWNEILCAISEVTKCHQLEQPDFLNCRFHPTLNKNLIYNKQSNRDSFFLFVGAVLDWYVCIFQITWGYLGYSNQHNLCIEIVKTNTIKFIDDWSNICEECILRMCVRILYKTNPIVTYRSE